MAQLEASMSSATAATANPSYRRVSSQEGVGAETNHRRSSSAPPLINSANTTTRPPLSERLVDKGIALAWLVTAVLVARYTGVYHVYNDARTIQSLLYASAACLAVNGLLLLYLVVYLPRVKGLTDSSAWAVYCPKVVPSMVLLGVVSFVLWIRACWPIWGCLAPLVLGTQVMGAVFSLHFVPWPF